MPMPATTSSDSTTVDANAMLEVNGTDNVEHKVGNEISETNGLGTSETILCVVRGSFVVVVVAVIDVRVGGVL